MISKSFSSSIFLNVGRVVFASFKNSCRGDSFCCSKISKICKNRAFFVFFEQKLTNFCVFSVIFWFSSIFSDFTNPSFFNFLKVLENTSLENRTFRLNVMSDVGSLKFNADKSFVSFSPTRGGMFSTSLVILVLYLPKSLMPRLFG